MTEIVVRGTLSDARHIELSEPISGFSGQVELTIRSVEQGSRRNVFDIIAGLRPGTRSKDDIDAQVREERRGWVDR